MGVISDMGLKGFLKKNPAILSSIDMKSLKMLGNITAFTSSLYWLFAQKSSLFVHNKNPLLSIPYLLQTQRFDTRRVNSVE
jgi:hypothetical protein